MKLVTPTEDILAIVFAKVLEKRSKKILKVEFSKSFENSENAPLTTDPTNTYANFFTTITSIFFTL